MDGINFKFFLDFGLSSFGRIEITEPVKFDGASFTTEQDKGRYGRDVTFGNEEVSLTFYEGLFDQTDAQLQLPDGTFINNLTMGLPFLLYQDEYTGFESDVKFILQKNGVDFTVGNLDFQLRKTDGLTYFETKIIQETKRAIINRRKDTKVDVFSNKNLDLEPITPLTTTNILLKAKPITQISEWDSHPRLSLAGAGTYVNTALALKKYGIEQSYIPFNEVSSGSQEVAVNHFRIIKAQETLSGVRVHMDTDIDFIYRTTGGDSSNSASIKLKYVIYPSPYTIFPSNGELVTVYEKEITGGASQDFTLPASFDFEVPPIPKDYSFSLYWAMDWDTVHLGGGDARTRWNFKKANVKITATSTAIDSVIKGVRYVDLFKQTVKSISGMDVVTPRFDVGGEHYNQFAFNGLLIRQFTDKPFPVTFKELFEGVQEVNGDYQVNQNEVFLGEYPDFYTNRDLGGFLQSPDDEFMSWFNERYTIVNLEYKYKTFETDRQESNTIDGVHTESQYLTPNKQVENVKKIDVPQIRDPFKIESYRKQGITTKDTTSLDSDDDLYLIDVVAMPPGSVGGFSSNLSQRIDETTGFLQLLNNDGESDGTFSWTLLGFNIGDTFKILNGSNIGWYTVQTIEPTLLTISAGGGSFTGVELITVEYPLTNVGYKNRTNEGFTLIENLDSGDNFSNLLRTIRRNLKHWESYLAAACKYKLDGIISNTYFKNNGLLRTRFGTERIYQENENINVTDLTEAILSPLVYKTRVIADFATVVQLWEDLNTINEDGSIGGFMRIADTNDRVLKLHPTVLDYEWSTNVLTITGEQRNESDYVTIDTLGSSLVLINEVGYNTAILSGEWYKTNGNYVTLFDSNTVPLINPTRIDKIKVNGILFTNAIDLSIALSEL